MRALSAVLLAGVLLLVGDRVQASVPWTPRGAGTTQEGRFALGASVGFPFLTVTGQYGFGSRVDAGVNLRSAWGGMQRAGLETRVRLLDNPSSALALRGAVDAWFWRPDESRWMDVTGTQDAGASLGVLFSWTTGRGTVITVDGTLIAIGNRKPRRPPLAGPPPWMAVGVNGSFRLGAEIPSQNGLVLGFDLGLDLHTSGFDAALAMPTFSVGLAAAL